MGEDLLALALELRAREEPFALATVVRCERPTSAKPGAKALVRRDGTLTGWVGGACAEPVVVREALDAIRDGQPRLVALVGDGTHVADRAEGLVRHPMTCHSGGTLEIYVEPFMPKPLLVLVGHGPVIEILAALGRATDFAVAEVAPEGISEQLSRLSPGRSASVVVATHGNADEDALERILASGAAEHVSLVASGKRAAMVIQILRERGVSPDSLDLLKAPAGLDIGAITPAEIAISILAEVVQHRRSRTLARAARDTESRPGVGAESSDPVCGMVVDIATARHRSQAGDGGLHVFCCAGCKERFDREPQRYLAGATGARVDQP